mmetsp:Transcript_7769/g.7015  ORF Transcript_7769/g.7015 Transcript_7769/m.7015 type:complete len:106 (-) Transcript_7769:329-646(-)
MADLEDVYETTDGYKYSPASFLLCKINDGDFLEHMCDDPDKDRDRSSIYGGRSIFVSEKKKVVLEKGEYLLRVKVDWVPMKKEETEKRKYVLSAYASSSIQLERF